jgi:hypothetical protein
MMDFRNSVLGEWCNIGDSNNSNLKNNYEEVKLSYETEGFAKTGLQFVADDGRSSKCGINTMFNTGTVVGVSAIFW